MTWQDADSWVLMALSEKAQRLDQVIQRMDWMNRDIPGHGELVGAMRRLIGAELAMAGPEGLSLTDRGREFVERAAGGARSVHTAWDRVRAALERLPAPRPAEWELRPAEFNAAVDRYRMEFARLNRRGS